MCMQTASPSQMSPGPFLHEKEPGYEATCGHTVLLVYQDPQMVIREQLFSPIFLVPCIFGAYLASKPPPMN